MRVMQVLPALDAGGVETGTLEIGRALVAAGHESLVVSAGGRMVERLESEGSTHLQLDIGRKSPATLFKVRAMRRLLHQTRPDILHLRSRLPAWVAWWAWQGLAEAERPRLVTTVHGSYSVSRYSAIMTRGERVIAVSEHIRRYILNNYPATDPARIEVIHRGVDLDRYFPGFRPDAAWLARWRAQYPQTAGRVLLVMPGRLTRWKGQLDFLRILAALRRQRPELMGVLVGEAHPRKRHFRVELEREIGRLGLEGQVLMTGHRSDLREILSLARLVFVLSGRPEAFGRTALEAVALGRPVVGYAHGGTEEILRTCFPQGLVPPGRVDEAVACAGRLLRRAEELPTGDVPFTLERMTGKTLCLYRALLAGPEASDG